MNNIIIKRVLHNCLKKKWIIVITMLWGGMLFGAYGVKIAMFQKQNWDEVSKQYTTDTTAYEQTVDKYDAIISELEESIQIVENQVESLQEYCDNSIYMNLDSQNIVIADAQYIVKNTEIAGNILSGLTSYINEGGLKADIKAMIGNVPVEYLKEIISCSTSSNTLNVSVMHYDEEQAKNIMNAIDLQLQVYSDEIKTAHSDFVFEKVNSSVYKKADITVLTAQNMQWTNLKNYKTNLSDLTDKLIVQELDRKTYVENKIPKVVYEKHMIGTILFYTVLGLLIGMMLPVIILLFVFIIDDRVISSRELSYTGISVLGVIHKFDTNELEVVCEKIVLLAQQNNRKKVFLSVMGTNREFNEIVMKCKDILESFNMEVVISKAILNNVDEMKELISSDNYISIVQVKETTYTQIHDQIGFCHKFRIPVWGSIVLDK